MSPNAEQFNEPHKIRTDFSLPGNFRGQAMLLAGDFDQKKYDNLRIAVQVWQSNPQDT